MEEIKDLHGFIGIQSKENMIGSDPVKILKNPYDKSYASKIHDFDVLNENEEYFLNAFLCQLNERDQSYISFRRMSNKTIDIQYDKMQIGRIKLYGRKTFIQILSLNDVVYIEDESLDYYITYISDWIKYINILKRNR